MELIHGNCLDNLKDLEENSIDSIVTDPPYGLSFMGKKWDYDVPSKEIWRECLRVLKPGGHLLAFAGTRTQHRMAVNIEDAGFEIRDMIAWVYGSGFPKSHNIGKVVDKMQGNEREVSSSSVDCEWTNKGESCKGHGDKNGRYGETVHALPDKGNSPWEGWGTALKPALEPITLARKPLSEKNIAANVLEHGTGGINIDGCRVESNEQIETGRAGRSGASNFNASIGEKQETHTGRFPANFCHDGSDEVVSLFPQTKSAKAGFRKSANGGVYRGNSLLTSKTENQGTMYYGDQGSAARFFYCSKASKRDRNEGLDDFEEKFSPTMGNGIGVKEHDPETATKKQNFHPTVKPTKLMQYLVRLVTPPNGICLDPFMGSGSTGKACVLEGFDFIGIEMDEEYIKIAKARIDYAQKQLKQTALF